MNTQRFVLLVIVASVFVFMTLGPTPFNSYPGYALLGWNTAGMWRHLGDEP